MTLTSKSLGNKIAEARKKINLSQAELAQQIAISAQAVGKWERGESLPDITTLNRLAIIFGVDLNYFSNSFQVPSSDTTTTNQAEKQSAELPFLARNKKIGLSWNMSSGNWVDADFSGLHNLKDKFSTSNMKNCKFLGSDLSDLVLGSNEIKACDFADSDLRNCKIQSSELLNNNFSNCSLIDAAFLRSELRNCTFTKANFSGAEFTTVNFEKNKIDDAVWNLTSFKSSHLSDVIFNGLIDECSFENCSFSRVTFKNTKILNTFFKGKKLKGITFEDCTADRISYEFLKNGKADLTGLTIVS